MSQQWNPEQTLAILRCQTAPIENYLDVQIMPVTYMNAIHRRQLGLL